MQLISKIISFLRKLFKKESLYVKLIVFLGKQKKYIPLGNEADDPNIISPDNVNSGSTIRETIVMIWREEEFYKVLIHELIHYFCVDFYLSDDVYNKINKVFTKIFTINGIDRVNESYTEALAISIHSIIYSQIKNIKFSEVLAYEILFSNFQIAKLLRYMKFRKYEDITHKKISQMTSACSYYIVKCMFLTNYHKLLQFWKENGFYVSDKNKNAYEIVYKSIVSIDSLDKTSINKMMEFIEKNEEKKFVYCTMRMSLFQL
jgi:hypothetical protein